MSNLEGQMVLEDTDKSVAVFMRLIVVLSVTEYEQCVNRNAVNKSW